MQSVYVDNLFQVPNNIYLLLFGNCSISLSFFAKPLSEKPCFVCFSKKVNNGEFPIEQYGVPEFIFYQAPSRFHALFVLHFSCDLLSNL